jgi:hypothetical protein
VISNAIGAQVFIDRKDIGAIGRAPFTGHLKPGKHTIYLERQGFAPVEKTIEVKPGTATQYTVPMEKTNTGWINVVGGATRGGRLVVDGKAACATPCRAEVAPGKRHVVVEKEGSENYEADLEIARTMETTVDIQVFSERPPKTRAISTGVTALVILGGGVYLGYLSQQAKDGLNADIKAGKAIDNGDSRFLRGKLEAIGADVLFGFSAIVAVSAITTLLAHGPETPGAVDSKSLGFAPTLGPDGVGGVSAWGRF